MASRDLITLLAELKCDGANKIRLAKVFGHSARARDSWSASFEGRSMLINRAERDLLQVAGAEFALPRYWDRCE